MGQTQSLFGQDNVNEIIDILKKEPVVKCERKKFPLSHVLVFRKNGTRYATYIPLSAVDPLSLVYYVSIRPITMDAKGCHVGDRCSGLALMPYFYGGIQYAIEKYNHISKDIGDYGIFGKIEALVSLVDKTTINFK